jgi:hypothetical protein
MIWHEAVRPCLHFFQKMVHLSAHSEV